MNKRERLKQPRMARHARKKSANNSQASDPSLRTLSSLAIHVKVAWTSACRESRMAVRFLGMLELVIMILIGRNCMF